jgi:hypothetical protein
VVSPTQQPVLKTLQGCNSCRHTLGKSTLAMNTRNNCCKHHDCSSWITTTAQHNNHKTTAKAPTQAVTKHQCYGADAPCSLQCSTPCFQLQPASPRREQCHHGLLPPHQLPVTPTWMLCECMRSGANAHACAVKQGMQSFTGSPAAQSCELLCLCAICCIYPPHKLHSCVTVGIQHTGRTAVPLSAATVAAQRRGSHTSSASAAVTVTPPLAAEPCSARRASSADRISLPTLRAEPA